MRALGIIDGSTDTRPWMILKHHIYRYSLDADGQDWNGLQLEKIGEVFQVFPVYCGEIAQKPDDSLFFPGEIP